MFHAAAQATPPAPISEASKPESYLDGRFGWLRLPFPTRFERAVFAVPGVAIAFPAAVLSLVCQGESDAVDMFFWLIVAASICSSFFTLAWWRSMPEFFTVLWHRRLKDQTAARDVILTLRTRLFGAWRFGPVMFALAVGGTFGYFFVTKEFSRGGAFGWWFLLLIWGWVIGGAASVVIAVALAIHRFGRDDTLTIVPDHPDRCGGLRFVGDFVARSSLPLLILSAVLAFAALDPHFGSNQLRFLANHFSSSYFSPLANLALEKELAAALAKARLESEKKECGQRVAETNAEGAASIACVRRLYDLTRAAEKAELVAAASPPRWRPTIVRAARLALVDIVVSALLCFLFPLWSLHRSMKAAQLAREELVSDAIRHALNAVSAARSLDDPAAVERTSKRLADLQKEAREFRSSLWPFDRELLAKVAVPQLLALGGGLAKAVLAFAH